MASTATLHGPPSARAVTACNVCGARELAQFLDLGATPLANKFLTRDEIDNGGAAEAVYPLKVSFCGDCGHVQLSEIVPPKVMFEDYLYVSSASDTLRNHLFELSGIIVDRRGLSSEDLVVDIGCNDGTLLKGFSRFGVRTLGVDPAKNLAELESGSGVERYVGLFGSESAEQISDRWGKASLITATNTFPHVQDLHDFMIGIDKALAPGGAFVVEAHYLYDMVDQGAFDTIYHEHVSYWALRPMVRLFSEHGFVVVDAERIPLHHGQLRVTAERAGEGKPSSRVRRILDAEEKRGLHRVETLERFAEQTTNVKEQMNDLIDGMLAAGQRIVGYGAPAKGNTLLGYLEIGPDEVEYIVDRSPLKQGRFTPGSHIPIVPVERLLEDQPDVAIVFAWNFLEEILRQQSEYGRRGGRFIVPIPTPVEVQSDDVELARIR